MNSEFPDTNGECSMYGLETAISSIRNFEIPPDGIAQSHLLPIGRLTTLMGRAAYSMGHGDRVPVCTGALLRSMMRLAPL